MDDSQILTAHCFCVAGGNPAPRQRINHLQAVFQELELNLVIVCDFQHWHITRHIPFLHI